MKSYGPKLQNATFRGDHDRSEMNACVGQNGQPGYTDYANGFSVAAAILIEKVIQEKDDKFLQYNLDELIYPIVFTMRHSVELRLKHTANYLQTLADKTSREIENFNHAQQHDIAIIFDYISKSAIRLDERYKFHIDAIAPFINDIAEIDPTGQTFRYPYDSTGKNKHLEDVSLINIYVLQDGFSKLEKLLSNLHELNKHIIEEYNEKSFTKNLSRLQLFKLARMLPTYDEWSHDNFDRARLDCRTHFEVSGNELSKAIDIIKIHYEMAPLIGLKVPLQAALKSDLIAFFDIWTKLHSNSSKGGIVSSTDIHGEIIEHLRTSHDAITEIETNIGPNAIADIQALFELMRFPTYSEYYVRVYQENKILLNRHFENDRRSFREEINYIVSKTNAFEYILKSLYRLKQLHLVEELEQRYSLHLQHVDLERVKNGSFYLPNTILNYEG